MSPYTMFPKCHGDFGGHLYTPYVLESWGASVHLSGISVSVNTSVAPQFITVIPVAPHHCGLLLYWPGCLWMSAMLCAVVPFFVVFSLCLKLLLSWLSTTLVTIVCSGTSSLLSTVTMAPSLMGLPVTSGQHDVVLPPLLTLRHSGGVLGPATAPQQQPLSQVPLQSYADYAMGPLQVGFSFRVEPPTICIFMFGVCSGVYFLLSGSMLDAILTYGGSTIGICTITTLWSLTMAGICATW